MQTASLFFSILSLKADLTHILRIHRSFKVAYESLFEILGGEIIQSHQLFTAPNLNYWAKLRLGKVESNKIREMKLVFMEYFIVQFHWN